MSARTSHPSSSPGTRRRWARGCGRPPGGVPTVVLGRDARTSGPMFAHAAAAGLMSVGVDVVDLGIVPTPTVQLAVEHHRAGAGLILTASHNPIEWNALKFVGPDGIFLDAADGERVRRLAEQGPPRAGWDGIGEVRSDPEAIRRHLDAIVGLGMIDVTAIRNRRFHIALDCVRGAGATAMLPLLEMLGCRVSGINLETDGHFPRAPEPVPENLGELGELVRSQRCGSRLRGGPGCGSAGGGGREGQGDRGRLHARLRGPSGVGQAQQCCERPRRGSESVDQPGGGRRRPGWGSQAAACAGRAKPTWLAPFGTRVR